MSGLFAQFGFLAPGWKDLLEILVVAWVLYRILLVLAGTRAIQMLLGLVLLVGIYFLARVLQLGLIRYLLASACPSSVAKLCRVDDGWVLGQRLLVCRILGLYPSERVEGFGIGIQIRITGDGPVGRR